MATMILVNIAARDQAISRTNVDFLEVKFCDIRLKTLHDKW